MVGSRKFLLPPKIPPEGFAAPQLGIFCSSRVIEGPVSPPEGRPSPRRHSTGGGQMNACVPAPSASRARLLQVSSDHRRHLRFQWPFRALCCGIGVLVASPQHSVLLDSVATAVACRRDLRYLSEARLTGCHCNNISPQFRHRFRPTQQSRIHFFCVSRSRVYRGWTTRLTSVRAQDARC